MPSLLLTEGALRGRRFPIAGTVVLGRANADLTIEDPLISRRHAVVRAAEGALEIEDLGSLNGTWVNDERITGTRRLQHGDVIRVGSTRAEVDDLEVERGTVRAPTLDEPRDAVAPPAAERPAAAGVHDELRTITALFADLVGSTGLGEQLPPQDVKALVGEVVTRVSRVIERFGGTVQAYMGDGVAAYFGVPLVHEDDPERAARAALAILAVVREYAEEAEAAWGIRELSVRVGINSGEVAVGVVGAATPQVVGLGDTTNVAARLQAAAEPGTIAVGELTARTLVHAFALEPLGEVALRGRGREVTAWRLLGPLGSAPRPSGPIVGRDAELRRLRGVLDDLAAGRGQVVLLLGDPGIGKTRVLAELRDLAGEQATWLEGHCVSYGTERLSEPFIEVLRGWLALEGSTSDLAVRTRLHAKLGLVPALDADVAAPRLARLLGVTPEADEDARLAAQLSPDELAGELRRAYRAWLGSLAESGPVVLALEDLHWADASTVQLAAELLELTDFVPLLVVATLRGDADTHGWRLRVRVHDAHAHRLTELSLAPLEAGDARTLLEALPGGADLGDALDEIVAEAEGNPLYLEELLNATAEGMRERERGRWSPTVSTPSPLTPTLESVLLARIDRLPAEARRLAQTASVVGRRFPLRVLEYLAGRDVADELAALMRADVVREARRSPEVEYAFRHGLLREAALSTLPSSRRRELHGAVGASFEALWGPEADDQLEVLAHHFALSNDLAKGLRYLERAAERAAALGAGDHADELWRRAYLVAERLGDAEALGRLQVYGPAAVEGRPDDSGGQGPEGATS